MISLFKKREYLKKERRDSRSVELGDDALEDLVDDAGQDDLVIVGTEFGVDLGERVDSGAAQDSERNVDHLQVCVFLRARNMQEGVGQLSGWLSPRRRRGY